MAKLRYICTLTLCLWTCQAQGQATSGGGSSTDTEDSKKKANSGQRTQRQLNSGGPGGAGGKAGKKGGATAAAEVAASISSDHSIYTLPVSFRLLGPVGIKAVVPYIDDGDQVLVGNSLVALSLGGRGSYFGAELSAGAILPTAKSSLADDQTTNDPYASFSLLLDTYPLRLVVKGSYIDRVAVEDYDRGNISTAFIGMDVPLTEYLRIYVSGFWSLQEDDLQAGQVLLTRFETTDVSFGFVFPLFVDIRVGATIPIATESETYTNEDREASTDFGLRIDI